MGTPVAKVVASVADSNFRSAGIWRRIDAWPCLFLAVVVVASAIILTFLAVVIWLSFREGAIGDPDAAASLANYFRA